MSRPSHNWRGPGVGAIHGRWKIPIQVSVTAKVSFDGGSYAMPPEAVGMSGTLFLYRDHVRIVAGLYQAQHPRYIAMGTVSHQPEHRAAQLAAISGKRGRRYLQREHLLETGEAALQSLKESVHRAPHSWFREVEILHDQLRRSEEAVMMAFCRVAIGIAGGNLFSVIDPMRTKRAPTGSVERVPGPFREHWR